MAVTRPDLGDNTLEVDFRSLSLTEEQFYQLCQDNPELQLELTASGELIVMSPTGSKTGWRNSKLNQRLANWSDQDGRGLCFDSNAGFTLPNGAKRSPDAAWALWERWNALSDEEQERFAPLCPDFVCELRSSQDNLGKLKHKMSEYIENGARLGWLIDPLEDRVYVYRPGSEVQLVDHPKSLEGGDVLKGFVLDLDGIL
jgi:Uma2 family endonuclease